MAAVLTTAIVHSTLIHTIGAEGADARMFIRAIATLCTVITKEFHSNAVIAI